MDWFRRKIGNQRTKDDGLFFYWVGLFWFRMFWFGVNSRRVWLKENNVNALKSAHVLEIKGYLKTKNKMSNGWFDVDSRLESILKGLDSIYQSRWLIFLMLEGWCLIGKIPIGNVARSIELWVNGTSIMVVQCRWFLYAKSVFVWIKSEGPWSMVEWLLALDTWHSTT